MHVVLIQTLARANNQADRSSGCNIRNH